jgi:hypothetical protein
MLSGSGANRAIAITPGTGQVGAAVIQLTVSDGTLSTMTPFSVMVVPSANVLLNDYFDYADGEVTANSGSLWAHGSVLDQAQTFNHSL